MPELPEVECVRRTMAPKLKGRLIRSFSLSGPDKLARPDARTMRRGLVGRRVARVGRHGKLLILELDSGGLWTIHLGMTGQVIMADSRPKADHVHITVGFAGPGPRLYYRDMRKFGGMSYCPDREALMAGPLRNFGPDALLIGAEELAGRLAGRRAPIKSLLLDQRILAGVGNIYADEALHIAGIAPTAAPADLDHDQLLGLHRSVRETLLLALSRGGSSVRNFVDAEGRAGTFQHAHRVYRRTGQPCPVCGATIERTVLAGRSTHFCPVCQGGRCQ